MTHTIDNNNEEKTPGEDKGSIVSKLSKVSKLSEESKLSKESNGSRESGGEKAESGWRKVLSLCLRVGLPLALTVLLVWYMFSKVDFAEIKDILSHGVDYTWILAAMAISVLSHIFRAARWRLQLRGLDIEPPFQALCCSIFGTYALNLLFPRLGEVWRCTYVARLEKAPFSKVLGSMVADRLSDTLTVLLLVLLTAVVAAPALAAFLAKYPIGRDLEVMLGNPLTWVVGIGAVLLVGGVCWMCRRQRWMQAILGFLRKLWDGFIVVAHMRGRGAFILLTLCIWACYFTQLYVAFYAFPFTKELCHEPGLAWGLTPCLVAFVFSSIGMAVPSNGGLGPWNIAVMFGLAIYGVTDAQGTAFSILVWSAQTVMLILLGIYTMIYISVTRTGDKKQLEKTIDETA